MPDSSARQWMRKFLSVIGVGREQTPKWIDVDLRKAKYSHPEWDFDRQCEHDESLNDLEAIVFKPGNAVRFSDHTIALIGTVNPNLGLCDCCHDYECYDVVAYCEAFDLGGWLNNSGATKCAEVA